jgi:hypothetical protein
MSGPAVKERFSLLGSPQLSGDRADHSRKLSRDASPGKSASRKNFMMTILCHDLWRVSHEFIGDGNP